LVKQIDIGDADLRIVYRVPPFPFVERPEGRFTRLCRASRPRFLTETCAMIASGPVAAVVRHEAVCRAAGLLTTAIIQPKPQAVNRRALSPKSRRFGLIWFQQSFFLTLPFVLVISGYRTYQIRPLGYGDMPAHWLSLFAAWKNGSRQGRRFSGFFFCESLRRRFRLNTYAMKSSRQIAARSSAAKRCSASRPPRQLSGSPFAARCSADERRYAHPVRHRAR
jgi:hypothetical protein